MKLGPNLRKAAHVITHAGPNNGPRAISMLRGDLSARKVAIVNLHDDLTDCSLRLVVVRGEVNGGKEDFLLCQMRMAIVRQYRAYRPSVILFHSI